MACRVFAIVVCCKDVETVSDFWAAALEYQVVRRWQDTLGLECVELDGAVPAFGRPQLLFRQVDEAEAAKNQMHVDVVVPAGGTGPHAWPMECASQRVSTSTNRSSRMAN